MADKLISQLGARAAVLTTDLMPLEPNAGPPAEKATIAQLITLLDSINGTGPYLPLAGGTMGGDILFSPDNAHDIGASGATRPGRIFTSSDIFCGGTLNAAAAAFSGGGFIAWTARSVLYSKADSTIVMQNSAETDFNRLQFGGTTSAFPSLKRSAALLQARLADDSLFTEIECSNIITNNAAAAFSTNTTLTDFAAAQLGTLTNAPTAGNPSKWIAIDDNGTQRLIPSWV